MHLYRDDVKITMTGLQEAYDFVEEISRKTQELENLLSDFKRHCLTVGIDIVRTEKNTVNNPEKAEGRT